MRLFIAMLPTLLLASAATDAQTLSIARSGSRPIRPAPADNFTGTARVDTLFETQDPLSASAGSVSFERMSSPCPVGTQTGEAERWRDYAVTAAGSVTVPGTASAASVAVSRYVCGSTPTSLADSHSV
jgi:hypothetical protein